MAVFLGTLLDVHGFVVELCVTLHHQFLESNEVVDGHDLVEQFFVDWVCSRSGTRFKEQLGSDPELV